MWCMSVGIIINRKGIRSPLIAKRTNNVFIANEYKYS